MVFLAARARLQAEARGEVPLHGFLDGRAARARCAPPRSRSTAGWRRRSISARRRCGAAATASWRWARSARPPKTPSTGWSSCAASTRTACSIAWPTRGALTPELMTALGARIAALPRRARADQVGLLQARRLSPLGGGRRAPDARGRRPPRSVDQRGLGRGHAARRSSRTSSWWRAASAAGAVRRCHGDLHLRNIVLLDGEPVPFDAIEFSERIANIDVLYDLAFALMDLCERRAAAAGQPPAERMAVAHRRAAARRRTRRRWRCCRCSCRGAPAIRAFVDASGGGGERQGTMRRARAPTRRWRWPSCSPRRRGCWRSAACRAAARPRWR